MLTQKSGKSHLTIADLARKAADNIDLIQDAANENNPTTRRAIADARRAWIQEAADDLDECTRRFCSKILTTANERLYLRLLEQKPGPLQLAGEIEVAMIPVLEWVKQHCSFETAAEFKKEMNEILEMMDKPPSLDLALFTKAALFSRKLRQWAGFIEAQDTPRPDEIEWTRADGPSKWAKLFGISPRSFIRLVEAGRIRARALTSKLYQVAIKDLPAQHQAKFLPTGQKAP
jgi:hypothetical protein